MVNIEKSIREKNLRFVDERFFGEVSYLAVLLSIFLIGPILGLISPIIYIDKTNEVFNATRDIVIASALIFFSNFANRHSKKLVSVDGFNLNINNRLLEVVLLIFNYQHSENLSKSHEIIIAHKTTFWGWRKNLTIIMEDGQVYFNLRTTGRFDIYSPFHFFSDKNELVELTKNFGKQVDKYKKTGQIWN
ncbi:hypothetical protein [Cognataquiflexum rubidum]|uniref:hypothetical protein n=1 Tax=Cognataquiflexum rubidum TaxID=2922273 RepID=UPI001F136FAB|nr:hypothetical protein [Cognataquiflexum rubidum]MCH6233333.1 hypothetical protein [Cognataquiflexum rubidum]